MKPNPILIAILLIGMIPNVQAAPPDLTNGGTPTTGNTINLGPTGLRGWAYHEGIKSSLSRQILVQQVEAGGSRWKQVEAGGSRVTGRRIARGG